MDRLIAFRAPSEVAEALRIAAQNRGCSVSQLIREAIDRDIGCCPNYDTEGGKIGHSRNSQNH